MDRRPSISFPQVALAHNNLGNYYGKELGMNEMRNGNTEFGAAIFLTELWEKYEDAQKANASYSKSYCNMGIVFAMRGDINSAITNFNKALELEPGYLEAIKNRGIAHAQSKQYQNALEDFNLAMDKSPARCRTHTLTAEWSTWKTKDFQQALNDFNTAVQYKPDYADAYYRRSDCFTTL